MPYIGTVRTVIHVTNYKRITDKYVINNYLAAINSESKALIVGGFRLINCLSYSMSDSDGISVTDPR